MLRWQRLVLPCLLLAACSSSSGDDAPSGQGGKAQGGAGSAGSASAGSAGSAKGGGSGASGSSGQAGAGLGGAGGQAAGAAGQGGAQAGSAQAGAGGSAGAQAGGGAGAQAGSSQAGSSQAGGGQAGDGAGGSGGQAGGAGSGGSGGSAGSGGSGGAAGSGATLPGGPRGMWVWQGEAITDPSVRAKLFAFCAEHEVTEVFANSEGALASKAGTSALVDFVGEAQGKGMQVELLFGDPTWTLTDNHGKAASLAQKAVEAFAGSASKPSGLHYDVEPHTLDTWESDQQAIANQYIDLVGELAAITAKGGLRLSVDVGHFYGGISVSRKGSEKPLIAWVLGSVDRAVLMAYRDKAEGPNGSLDITADEFQIAQGSGKKLLIGAETSCAADLTANLTFCGDGAAALEGALETIRDALSPRAEFGGVAVHDWKAYQQLK